MNKYTNEEIDLINSLNKPIDNLDMSLVNSIVDKMLRNNDFEKLINFLNSLYDFAKIPKSIVDILIQTDNKECISVFLENESVLYFLTTEEINSLKNYINVPEVNIKLTESYDYYYKLLYKQGIRSWHNNINKSNGNIIVHTFTQYNQLIKLKLKEVKNLGIVASCTIYSNYNLSEEEQILNGIDYLNKFGFNIKRDINNLAIVKTKMI
jgi:hypothetical protein